MLLLKKLKSFVSRGDYYRGLVYYQTGNYAKALPLLRLYEDRESSNEAYLLKIVTCLLRQKKEKAARPIINKILKLNPDNVACYFLQAELYLRKKDYRMAKQFYEKVAAPDKDHDYYQLLIALCDFELKDYDQAEKIVQRIIAKSQCLNSAYYLLARIDFKKKSYTTAERHVKHALSFHKKDNLVVSLGRAYELCGDIQSALCTYVPAAENYNKAIVCHPERKLTVTYKLIGNEMLERKFNAAKQKLDEIIKEHNARKAYGLRAEIAAHENNHIKAFEGYMHYLADSNFNHKKLPAKARREMLKNWHEIGKKLDSEILKALIKDPARKDLHALIKEYRQSYSLPETADIFKEPETGEQKPPPSKK